MNNEKKKRIALWLYPSEIEQLDKWLKESPHPSRNTFISAAINFYGGYLNTKMKNEYLPLALASAMQGISDASDDRIARLLFKLSIEMSMMMHVLASTCDINEETLKKLRGKCVQDIKKSVGKVDLMEVARYQRK